MNIEHHSYDEVEKKLNENFGEEGFELVTIIDMGENNTNKDGKAQDLDTFLKKMNKKVVLKDLNNRNYYINDFNKFKKHILEFHGTGSSIHEENGFFFRIDKNLEKIFLKSKNQNNKNDISYL